MSKTAKKQVFDLKKFRDDPYRYCGYSEVYPDPWENFPGLVTRTGSSYP
jgi:hypothetical protein